MLTYLFLIFLRSKLDSFCLPQPSADSVAPPPSLVATSWNETISALSANQCRTELPSAGKNESSNDGGSRLQQSLPNHSFTTVSSGTPEVLKQLQRLTSPPSSSLNCSTTTTPEQVQQRKPELLQHQLSVTHLESKNSLPLHPLSAPKSLRDPELEPSDSLPRHDLPRTQSIKRVHRSDLVEQVGSSEHSKMVLLRMSKPCCNPLREGPYSSSWELVHISVDGCLDEIQRLQIV